MSEAMKFSLRTMKQCSGAVPSDADYLKWFLSECESRLLKSASALAELVNGAEVFTGNTQGEVLALHADVRRHVHILRDCAAWFAGKPHVASKFTDKLKKCQPEIDSAEAACATLLEWFK